MPTEKKAKIIDDLQKVFDKSNIIILTDYRGLHTAEMNEVRRALKKTNADYRVVKNTLARFAAEKVGKKDLDTLLKGPVAVALGYGDVIEPAKALANYIRETKSTLRVKGGFLGTRLLTAEEVAELAKMPPREVILAQVLGGIQSPISSFISYLASPMRGMLGILQARIKQMEGT